MRDKISITISNSLLKQIDAIIDNIYIRNRSQAIEHLVSSALGENKSAVILCGGKENSQEISKGTYRITAKIDEETVVEKAVKKLRENGFKNVFIVAAGKVLTKIFDLLKEGNQAGVKLTYIEEKEQKGSAASLRLLKGKIKTPFLIVYGDLLFNKINIEGIWNDHIKHKAISTLMMTTSKNPSLKGTLKVEGNKILEFTQKPKTSDIYLVFSPIFVAEPEILEYGGDSLEKEIFPELANKGLLNGHLSSEKETHIHSINDVKAAQAKHL